MRIGSFCLALAAALLLGIANPRLVHADIQLSVPLYCQGAGICGGVGNTSWGSTTLGNGSCSGISIGCYGCAITATAMVLKYYGVSTDPGDLNTYLNSHSGYGSNGAGCNDELIWGIAAGKSGGTVSYVGDWEYQTVAADLSRINSELTSGYPVIAEVRLNGYTHFVLITGYSGTTYYINDPWYNDSGVSLASRYKDANGNYNDPAGAIYSIREYHGPTNQPQTEWIVTNFSLQGSGWNTYSGGGYNGADAYYASGNDSTRKAIWTLPSSVPFGLYQLSAYIPSNNATAWIAYDVQSGSPYDNGIPWAGAIGTNQQWVGTNQNNDYGWTVLGPGPQAPQSASFTAGPNGNYMWMGGSYNTIYVSFNQSFTISGNVGISAIKIDWIASPPAPSAPAITTQPQPATICSGNTNTFTVAAVGTGTLSYQWQRGGSNIGGATSTSYNTGTAGSYDCVVTNSGGSTTSNSVTLTVNSAPSITSQPTAATICPGNANTFTVGASGANLSYQWQLNGGAIGGANSSSYAAGTAGSYNCVISNSCGAATSNSVSLTVNSAPSITTQPQAATICSGNTNTFTAAASGSPSPSYQWRLNGSSIGGATSSSYTTDAAGNYDCVAINSCGTATSNSVTLTVNSAPSITSQPTSATICPGNTNTFTVGASGANLSYQWQLNGSAIGGANSSSYAAGAAGSYNCVISNSCGSATSNSVSLTVNTAPLITTQPTPHAVCSGNTAMFTAAASGNPAPTYQWRLNGSNIGGATSSSYTTGVAGNYDCVATNSCGSATSNLAALTVNSAPNITTQPQAATVCSGNTNTFTVAASGTAPLSYQWQLGGSNIDGATSSAYATGVAGAYRCVITNSCGSATSGSVVLTVDAAPQVTTQPQAASVSAGTTNTFTVAASGTAPLSYQWRLYGSSIGGATSSSYTTGVGGSYDCVVTNSCGVVTSNAAALTINGGTQVATVATAKLFADGTVLTLLSGPVVTWSFNDFFYYVEDVNRAAGMRVIPGGSSVPAQGSVGTIVGTIQTLAGERVIQNAVVSNISSGAAPSPLGMTGNSANMPLAQGLWVRLWGVAVVPPGATDTFTLHDGSDYPVRVKLYGIGLPDDGVFINVIGVLGEDAGGPLLRINNSSDIW